MTNDVNNRGLATLVIGDLIAYIFSLILTLAIRYEAIPSRDLLLSHAVPFGILFVIFLAVSFSAGLYDKQVAFIRGRIQGLIARTQIVDFLIGIAFFYLAPVAISPKANLIIYFLISTIVLVVWRLLMVPVVTMSRKQNAILVGAGEDVEDLRIEVNNHIRYSFSFKEIVTPKSSPEDTVSAINEAVKKNNASVIVADLHNKSVESAMPLLYSLIFSGVRIVDAGKLYESIFDRIPLSMVGERWLVENSATALGMRKIYDTLKRLMDIAISGILAIISLIFYPFVYLAIKLDDRGPIFITQDRIGRNGKTIKIMKFRSMSGNDNGRYGNGGVTNNSITRVGKFIRASRIDELPQLWNVLRGDLSLIGPRPELPTLVQVYEKEIPYYNARHLVKPGLSGWAQIYHEAHPHHAVATAETRDKLSYDLYYIKNRSLTVDFKIALRTLQIVMKRSGR